MFCIIDDIAVIAENKKDLTNMLEEMNDTLKEHYIKINQRKTKILLCNKQQFYANIVLDGMLMETVQNFTYIDKYLGNKITSDWKSHTDTICRTAQAKQAYYKKRNLFISNRVSLDTKKSLTKS